MSSEIGPSARVNYRLNYKQPIIENVFIEAGTQGRIGKSDETNEIYYYNILTGVYNFQDQFSHDVSYKNNYHAIYGLVLGELGSLGYQFGLRAEKTNRLVTLEDTGHDFSINRWDYFPSVHFSYQLQRNSQLMANYTKRINRPRGYYLEPFYTWTDAYNVRIGNPLVRPEYINAFELSYHKEYSKHAVSAEVFYHSTLNKIESIRSAFSDSVILRTFENVGTDSELGIEVMANMDIMDQWETNLTARFYYYEVAGMYNNTNYERNSFSWLVRWNNIIKITKTTRLQFNPAYRSPEVEAQELESGYFIADGAVQQSFMNKKFDVTLQVRDIFRTAKRESEINGSDLYSYQLYKHKSPVVMLNLTWHINNYKKRSEKDSRGGGNGDEDDMD